MNPVAQRRLWRPDDHADGPQRGDCQAACIASIFERPYEDCAAIEATSATVADWTSSHLAGVSAICQMLGKGWTEPECIGDHVNWPTHHYERGFWMAAVWSPRIPDAETFDCGCAYDEDGKPCPADPDCEWCGGSPDTRSMGITWGLHAVVMDGAQLAWDPHPDADPATPLYFRSATTWRVSDPARLPFRCTRGACGEGIVDECYHRPARDR